jgi:hypothetical protein
MANHDYEPCLVCGSTGDCEHRPDHKAFEEASKSNNPDETKEFEQAQESERKGKDDDFKIGNNF